MITDFKNTYFYILKYISLYFILQVLFKMDVNGNGLLVDQEQLYLVMGVRSEHFNMDNFLYMCILSGCDYLSSLPGIGLNKAKKFISGNTDCDIYRVNCFIYIYIFTNYLNLCINSYFYKYIFIFIGFNSIRILFKYEIFSCFKTV